MSDALERLRNRQRPEVPMRDATLQIPDAQSNATQNSRLVDTSTSRYLETSDSTLSDGKPVEDLKTKQSTMRLAADVSDRLQSACRENGLSREVLIEALFLHCEADPQVWQSVVAEAKKRADYRQQVANVRRAQSMMQKFGGTRSP